MTVFRIMRTDPVRNCSYRINGGIEMKESTMMSLFSYQDVKAIQSERRERSLRRRANSRITPPDTYLRPRREVEAEVVELVFATACDTDRIGA